MARCFGCCLLLLLSVVAFAGSNRDFVAFNYNIKSVGGHLTDAQCHQYFKQPVYYNIVNGQSVYHDGKLNRMMKPYNYKRLNETFISKNMRLFYGKRNLRFKKSLVLSEDISFLLNLDTHTIRGSFYVPYYCKGNMIGVKQNEGVWKHPVKS